MNQEQTQVVVVFRKWKDTGTILALFPYEEFSPRGGCMSYEHVGQHGEADYNHCVKATKPATAKEYEPLAKELMSIGYNLVVKKRMVRK